MRARYYAVGLLTYSGTFFGSYVTEALIFITKHQLERHNTAVLLFDKFDCALGKNLFYASLHCNIHFKFAL